MTDDLVKQAMAELADVVRCRCNEAYTGRGLHDPDCQCDSAEAVKVLADRIEELEAKLAKIESLMVRNVKFAEQSKATAGSGSSKRREHYRMHALSEVLGQIRKIMKGQDDGS